MYVQGNAADLYTLLEKMRSEVTDKTSLRYLNKFEGILTKISPPDVTGVYYWWNEESVRGWN